MTPESLGSVTPLGRAGEGSGESPPGTLIIIGGGEEKSGTAAILAEVVRRVGDGRLLISAVASRYQEELFELYRDAFAALGLDDVAPLRIRGRGDASREENLRAFDGASGVFFTGGDQLRITSNVADTPLHHRIADLYRRGGVVAGTSAGASALGDTMMVSGPSDRSHRLGDLLRMAQGLELIPGLIIDQHFAERGRMGRLLGAVAQNPGSLAVGIDEDTAIVVEGGDAFRVLGAGTVYVVDGEAMTHTNVTEGASDVALSAYDLTLHLLGEGDRYDMVERRPHPAQEATYPHPAEVRRERRERRLAERRAGGDRRRGGGRRASDREAGATGTASGRRRSERRDAERREEAPRVPEGRASDRRGRREGDRREESPSDRGTQGHDRRAGDAGGGDPGRGVEELAAEERREHAGRRGDPRERD